MKGLEATSLLFLECPDTKGTSTPGRLSPASSDTKGWSSKCTPSPLAGPPLGSFLSVCPILSNRASFSKGQILGFYFLALLHSFLGWP